MISDASAIAESVRSGARSAVEVVEAHLTVAEAVNTDLNAFTEIDRAGALERAAHIDAGPKTGPLTGVPIALKDLIDHAGHVTTAGSAFYRSTPERSATIVDRLEEAGAVIIGRTGLHEFAFGFSSENDWHGPVRNPLDPTLSPGGSSGGSAAAVAAGAVPAAIGTDTGGSVRVPAALCGQVGLKVTHGRVPLTGVFPLGESLDTVGPIASTVAGARLVYEAVAGFDERDPWSVAVDDSPTAPITLTGLRVAIPAAWVEAVPMSSETASGFERFRQALASLGAVVDTVEAPGLVPDPVLSALVDVEAAKVHRSWFTDIDKPYGAEIEGRLAAAMEVTSDQAVDARRRQAVAVQTSRALFADFDVLLTPTVGHPAKVIGEDMVELNGVEVFYRSLLSPFTSLVNQIRCPAVALPLSDPSSGLPHSIQFIGPWWHESRLLHVSSLLESAGVVSSHSAP